MRCSELATVEVNMYRPNLGTKLALLPSTWSRWLLGLLLLARRKILSLREVVALR
jgi:hypothetical protein